MERDDFIRDLRRYCRKNGLSFSWRPAKGKGGHGEVGVSGRFTTVQTKLTPYRIETILKQLGLPKDAV